MLPCLGFLYKRLYTKLAVSERSVELARLNVTFVPLGLSLGNLAHLFSMLLATNYCLRFFKLLLLLIYSFHPIAEITLKNANIKDEFKGASTRIN